jgi:hypothetical protein
VTVSVGWVQPPKYKKGLDPLGVQQPCIAIYTELLPGITNVTDRVAYFSFGPWIAWAFSNRYPAGTAAQFTEILRRAEVLLTLVGARHGLTTEPDHFDEHGGSLVGVLTLRKVVEGAPDSRALKLSDYALLEDSEFRYFKNRRGGLGQYYLGSLRDEYHLLDDRRGGLIDFTIERGGTLAEAFNAGIDQELFFTCLEHDRVTMKGLDKLSKFCPCQLRSKQRTAERSLLGATILGELPELSEHPRQRRSSLAVLADFLNSAAGCEATYDQVDEFLTSCYALVLPDGRHWSPQPALLPTVKHWGFYVRNELLSIAMQRLFREALSAIGRDDPRSWTVETTAAWCTAVEPFMGALAKLNFETFGDLVSDAKANLPARWDVSNARHEIALWDEVMSKSGTEGVVAAIQLLATLIARPGSLPDSFQGATGSSLFRLDHYPINVQSFSKHAQDSWRQMALGRWLAECLSWVMSTHRQVALRKLAQSGDDTRRLRMGDEGLYFEGDLIEVVRTQPRLAQAFRILRDLGLTDRAMGGRMPMLTTEGQAFLRSVIDET